MSEKRNPAHFEHTWATRWLVPAAIVILLAVLAVIIVLSVI